MTIINAGIIGCGQIGGGYDEEMLDNNIRTHVKAYKQNPHVDLKSVSDVDQQRLNQFAENWEVENRYTDYEEMLKNEMIDILSICTKPVNRFEMIRKAVDTGVRLIFCEKPLADSLDEGQKIIDYCYSNNVKLAVNYKRRWDVFHQQVKNNIINGEYGKPESFYCTYVRGVNNYGTHIIDLIRFFLGEIDWVWAYDRINEKENDPSIDAYLLTKSGVGCFLISSNRDNFDLFEYSMLFSRKKIEFKKEGSLAMVYELSDNPDYLDLPIFTYTKEIKTMWQILKTSVDQLVNCLINNEEPYCTGKDGLASLKIASAIRKSAEYGEKIFI
tara:strand:- start:44 stop:1027 length:984 start_codon:yes stop_codon:yes gene_type:complete